jgi:hypothetical protein
MLDLEHEFDYLQNGAKDTKRAVPMKINTMVMVTGLMDRENYNDFRISRYLGERIGTLISGED